MLNMIFSVLNPNEQYIVLVNIIIQNDLQIISHYHLLTLCLVDPREHVGLLYYDAVTKP